MSFPPTDWRYLADREEIKKALETGDVSFLRFGLSWSLTPQGTQFWKDAVEGGVMTGELRKVVQEMLVAVDAYEAERASG